MTTEKQAMMTDITEDDRAFFAAQWDLPEGEEWFMIDAYTYRENQPDWTELVVETDTCDIHILRYEDGSYSASIFDAEFSWLKIQAPSRDALVAAISWPEITYRETPGTSAERRIKTRGTNLNLIDELRFHGFSRPDADAQHYTHPNGLVISKLTDDHYIVGKSQGETIELAARKELTRLPLYLRKARDASDPKAEINRLIEYGELLALLSQ